MRSLSGAWVGIRHESSTGLGRMSTRHLAPAVRRTPSAGPPDGRGGGTEGWSGTFPRMERAFSPRRSWGNVPRPSRCAVADASHMALAWAGMERAVGAVTGHLPPWHLPCGGRLRRALPMVGGGGGGGRLGWDGLSALAAHGNVPRPSRCAVADASHIALAWAGMERAVGAVTGHLPAAPACGGGLRAGPPMVGGGEAEVWLGAGGWRICGSHPC